MSPSGESIEHRTVHEKPQLQLEIVKINDKSSENLVLDNRLPLEPPDLIPKIPLPSRKPCVVQDLSNSNQDYEYNRTSYERYRLLPTSFNPRLGSTRLGFPEISEEKSDINRHSISSISSKSECDLRERLGDSTEMRKVYEAEPDEQSEVQIESQLTPLIPLSEIKIEKEDTSLRIPTHDELQDRKKDRSPILNERDQFSPPDVTRTRHLVERSTSFGKGDTMTIVDLEVVADVDGDEDAGIALSDAASQTDLLDDQEGIDDEEHFIDTHNYSDDLEVERLSRDLASQLSPSDKLLSLLVPAAERKRPTDYVAGLFRLDGNCRRRQPRKHKTGSSCSNASSTSSSSTTSASTTSSASSSSHSSPQHSAQPDLKPEPVTPLPSSSPYFTTSESKARLLAQYPTGVDNLPLRDSAELKQKKEELTQRLDKKLEILKGEQLSLGEEAGLNDELGAAVATLVARVARPHEATKYRLHVEEVGKITSLLLGLSGRLARAENALIGLPHHHTERKIHEEKRDKLREQLAEAKTLKESIDRRSDAVCKTLGKYLSEEDLADYLHFIHMKEKLIVDAREVADKIALGEEQLAALSDTHGTWP